MNKHPLWTTITLEEIKDNITRARQKAYECEYEHDSNRRFEMLCNIVNRLDFLLEELEDIKCEDEEDVE